MNTTELINSLRPGQKSLANWQGGKMAIAAVPGAGKSHSLSVAAALTIVRQQLHPQRQLVIVTYTRSAAASIKTKIRKFLQELSLPQWGFFVQTLHGLALNIATRYPDLHHLNFETATLITLTSDHRLIRSCVEQWLLANPHLYQRLVEGIRFDGEEAERLRRQSVLRTEVLPSLAYTMIREAKSSGLLPEDLQTLHTQSQDEYEILAIAAGLYQQYQKLMLMQNWIDYDDMILAALEVLDNPIVRQMWQNQVFAVFEDEAQDSSPLQEKLISLLAVDPHNPDNTNLVRVGDPNQAINSTFTPADPIYFNWFCDTCKNHNSLDTMNQAGRSSPIIIEAANFVLKWVNQHWSQTKEYPFRLQEIQPVSPDDPQPDANPTPEGLGLEIYTPEDIYQTVQLIGQRVTNLLEKNPQRNAAILVRENRQGRFLADKLGNLYPKLKIYEVGEVQRHSHIPQEIFKLLSFIVRPHSPDNLKGALEILEQRQLIASQDFNALATYPEQFLYPTPLSPPQKPEVIQARRYCGNLLRAKLELPPYQLIPFLGMTLKYTGSELATVQKLADRINQQIIRRNSLDNIITVLNEIVSSERFEGVEEDNDDQYTRPNQLTIITMHKAKGLDWDYVFIPFLHDDVLPGQLRVPVSAKFLGDFTLAEVARAQIKNALHSQYQGKPVKITQPLQAWEEAKRLKTAEEFRLLYVAMTRAKRLLWLSAAKQGPFSWSMFRDKGASNLQEKQPCRVLSALKAQFRDILQTAN